MTGRLPCGSPKAGRTASATLSISSFKVLSRPEERTAAGLYLPAVSGKKAAVPSNWFATPMPTDETPIAGPP